MRKPVLSNDEEIAPRPAVEYEHNDINEVVERLKERRKDVEKKMMNNIQIAQKRQKNAYDIRQHVNKTKGYNIGHKVLQNIFTEKGLCTQTPYTGPYFIFASCGKCNFKLQDCVDKETNSGPYNQKSLKAFHEEGYISTNDVNEVSVDINNNAAK